MLRINIIVIIKASAIPNLNNLTFRNFPNFLSRHGKAFLCDVVS